MPPIFNREIISKTELSNAKKTIKSKHQNYIVLGNKNYKGDNFMMPSANTSVGSTPRLDIFEKELNQKELKPLAAGTGGNCFVTKQELLKMQ